MNTVEDRVRAALHAHAEDFSVHPDAWRQLAARRQSGRRRWAARRRFRPASFMIPAAAAAAVAVVIVVAAVTVNGVTGRSAGSPSGGARSTDATPSATAPASPEPSESPTRGPLPGNMPPAMFLAQEPPSSAILTLRLPSEKAVAYVWLAYNSPAYWLDWIGPGVQLCHFAESLGNGGGSGFCWTLPHLGAGHLAFVTGNEGSWVGGGQQISVGAAARQVRSVAAVLPDGRVFPGAIGTGRGFPYNAWTVGYPPSAGVRLVFRDAAGDEIASLSTAAPAGPPQLLTPPRSGGVPVFRYVGGFGERPGTVVGYLIDGRVGFWSTIWGGEIYQRPVSGGPVVAGLVNPFDQAKNGGWKTVEAFGFAQADVARVVLHVDGLEVSTSTFVAGWAGSDLRLWAVPLPPGTWMPGRPLPSPVATAYDSAGHVLGQVQLGGMG